MEAYDSFTASKMDVSITAFETCHRLRLANERGIFSLNMTTEQLLEIAEAIEWYLFKKDDPAAVLEEILEELK